MLNLMISFNVLKLVGGYKLHRHSFVLRCKHKPKYDMHHHFFSYSIILVCNLLPESIVSSSTLATFKTGLKKFDLMIFDLFVSITTVYI